ncbi:response regulator [Bosea sp. 2YAB26]|uniref:response regulator n=1 Tax=Bosea sp. 2YAB26 TaxID=3237478 RepID=UPI003F8F8294
MSRSAPITVLVVEDEPFVRMDAVDMVEEAGFIAVEAANADEAIRILETNPDIRIIFTDIGMPGSMDGIKLAFAVRERWPPVVIIIASGHQKPLAADLPARARFFAKPYEHAAIKAALREAV